MNSTFGVLFASKARKFLSGSDPDRQPEKCDVARLQRPLHVTHAAHAIAVEFLTSALLTAVTASMIKARTDDRRLRFSVPVEHYLPQVPNSIHDIIRSDEAIFFNRNLGAALIVFYDTLRIARQTVPEDIAVWQGDAAEGGEDWDALGRTWQKLCGEARLVLLALCEFDFLCDTDQSARLFEIEELVKTARYGGTPCLRVDNLIIVPGWLDQRRDTRIPLGLSVQIEIGNNRRRATIRDLSVAGFGLSHCPAVPNGTSIVVTLPEGTRISGMAMWSHGGNVGVQFSHRISETSHAYRQAMSLSRKSRLADSST
jgi:hypothetical protein